MKKKSGSVKALKSVLSFSLYLFVVLLFAYLIFTFVCRKTVVQGESMEPTYSNGDYLMIEKISYYRHKPHRFDVVVFPYRYERNTFFVKRVIGLPGETVRIDEDGQIYINDKVLTDRYGKEAIEDPGIALTGITLEKNQYFVLGDNRNNSVDSRSFDVGPIQKDSIIGKVWFRFPRLFKR